MKVCRCATQTLQCLDVPNSWLRHQTCGSPLPLRTMVKEISAQRLNAWGLDKAQACPSKSKQVRTRKSFGKQEEKHRNARNLWEDSKNGLQVSSKKHASKKFQLELDKGKMQVSDRAMESMLLHSEPIISTVPLICLTGPLSFSTVHLSVSVRPSRQLWHHWFA